MKREECKLALWKEFVEKAPYIDGVRKEGCMHLGELFLNGDVAFLYEMYYALMEQERFRIEEKLELEYEKDGADYLLRYQGEEWCFNYEQMKEFLERMTGIFEDVLPLGSVVELKMDFLKKTLPLDDVEYVRVVIVQRYVDESPEGFYYPYAGALYPVGNPGTAKLLEFTPSLIEKIVSKGYSDEQEEAYVFLMKKELMLERGLHSMGFADKEQREAYQRFLEGGKKNGVSAG